MAVVVTRQLSGKLVHHQPVQSTVAHSPRVCIYPPAVTFNVSNTVDSPPPHPLPTPPFTLRIAKRMAPFFSFAFSQVMKKGVDEKRAHCQ